MRHTNENRPASRLHRLAPRWLSRRPRPAATRAEEAAALREYAQRYIGREPSFAEDLLAAARRHEMTV